MCDPTLDGLRSYISRRYVCEPSYIHTKLMIVDDRRVIVRIPPFNLLDCDDHFRTQDGFSQLQ